MGVTYKESGVDIHAGDSFVDQIAPIVKSTFTERVITDIGGFGALYSGAFPDMKEPVLVSGTDGVGTKLKIAQMMGIHNTIGIDAVAMCVNDILVSGARPLFFLDYLACGKIQEKVMVDIVKGLAEGCRQAGCSLVGGETAEHPGLMAEDDYDIGGFSVGVVDRPKIINGRNIKKGDVVIGIPSSGIHSNGYSLVRHLFFNLKKYTVETKLNDLPDVLGKVLLEPTKIYCKNINACLDSGLTIDGMVHITGSGFYGNIPRVLPDNVSVQIDKDSYEVPPIFKVIQRDGEITEEEMYTTFNMGIGLMVFCKMDQADRILGVLNNEYQSKATIIGKVVENEGPRVILV